MRTYCQILYMRIATALVCWVNIEAYEVFHRHLVDVRTLQQLIIYTCNIL